MTGRERMNAVLHRQPTDRLPWTTLVDDATLSQFPEHLRGNGGIDFYRGIGCDVFLLNGWNTPYSFRSPKFAWPDSVEEVVRRDGPRTIREWRTPYGTLVGISERGHPVKYPVDRVEAVRLYRRMWEGATFAGCSDEEPLRALDGLIGDSGVMTRFWGPSTIPRLIEYDMGVEGFYYLLADYPAEVEGLIRTIHERELDAFECLARGPWDSVTLVENTSTYYVSPVVYERFNMPHQRDFVRIVKGRGKVALLHMCGHVRGILPLIKETGCDGIHALTPPPTGDTPWEDALDVLGEDLVIFGCLDPSVFVMGAVDQIGPALDRLVTPRLRQANFVLAPFADGIAVDLRRFEAVKEWVRRSCAALTS